MCNGKTDLRGNAGNLNQSVGQRSEIYSFVYSRKYQNQSAKYLFFIKISLTIVRADMVVERCYYDYEQKIFFEMLKNANVESIRSYVQEQLTEELLEEYSKGRQLFKLEKPYSLIIPGSKHKYAFTGVYIMDLNEKNW